MAEEEEGTVGEPRPAEPAPVDSRHPLTYRKTTNFALDKFLDPARPYKCTVCKESFTQKNILLVHYNSVSHLHKMKKAAIDPSGPARGEAGTTPTTAAATDKPFKCTVCRVSYNQSSTLEIDHLLALLAWEPHAVLLLSQRPQGESFRGQMKTSMPLRERFLRSEARSRSKASSFLPGLPSGAECHSPITGRMRRQLVLERTQVLETRHALPCHFLAM